MKSKALYAQSSWQPQIKTNHASWKGLKEVHWSSPTQSRSSWARMHRVISRWDSLQGWRFHFSLCRPPLHFTALNFSFYFTSELFHIPTLKLVFLASDPFTVSPGHTGLFLQAFFPLVSQPILLHSCSILIAGLLICLYLNSWRSCQPIFPSFLGHSKKQPVL